VVEGIDCFGEADEEHPEASTQSRTPTADRNLVSRQPAMHLVIWVSEAKRQSINFDAVRLSGSSQPSDSSWKRPDDPSE
jgi:hypothetical protein